MTKKPDIPNNLKEFKLNSMDLSRISSDQRELRKYNTLNNTDIPLNIISNSYLETYIIVNDPKYSNMTFKLLSEITLYEDKIILHLQNVNEDMKIEVVYGKNKLFEKLF